MNPTRITAPAGSPFVDIEREFDAPRELVFRAYADPDLLRQWLGLGRYEMVIDRWEPRDGSRWRYVHRAADGTEHAFHGVFHGSQTADGMLQTFEYEGAPGHVSLDAVRFIERDGRTLVRTHSVHQSVEARDAMVESGMGDGLIAGFDMLDRLLAAMRPPAAAAR